MSIYIHTHTHTGENWLHLGVDLSLGGEECRGEIIHILHYLLTFIQPYFVEKCINNIWDQRGGEKYG